MGMGAGPGSRAMPGFNLSSEQQEKMKAIMMETHQQQTQLMQAILAERPTLEKLYGSKPLDAGAIGAAYGRIFDLRRQMIENMINMHNQADGLMSAEQSAQPEKSQSAK
ncbi:MAG: periplasmic heavy metal sensor, partial [Gammaproteobacteria bacterium]|nr:periplasmic heavy metal sensor [Gammaproteobacteria bacterium]